MVGFYRVVLCGLIFCGVVRLSNGDLTPFVAWSMDNHTDTTLIPAYNTDPRFQADFSALSFEPEDAFKQGVVGNAIYLNRRQFALAKDIKRDCMQDPDACTHGFSFLFWLNVLEWSEENKEFQTIFRTTTWSRALPGIFFGRDEDSLLLSLRRTSGKTHSTTFPMARVTNTWTHVGITWSLAEETLLLYLDGIAQTTDTTTNSAGILTFTDFDVGSYAGPSFLLDEFNVYYQTVSPEDLVTLYQTVAATLTTTARSTTSSVATTTPVTTTTPTTTTTTTTPVTTSMATTTPVTTSMATTTTTTPVSASTPATSPTQAISTSTSEPTATGNTMSTWLIVLIALMCIIIFILCFLLLFCLCRKSRRRESRQINPVTAEMDSFHDEPDGLQSAREETDNDTDAEAANSMLIRNR